MRFLAFALSAAALLFLAGCSTTPSRSLPKWQAPLARTQYQTVRTTAYNDHEADHIRYTNHNALGTTLQYGAMRSAAADWGRWPAGTTFRILQTGETYIVDDYGWDLAGTNTIDLYKPTRAQMNAWGARYVNIQILQWGDLSLSYRTLEPRTGYKHVARMLAELRPQMRHPDLPVYGSAPPADTLAYVSLPAAPHYNPSKPRVVTMSRIAPSHSSSGNSGSNGVSLTPFY